MKEIEIVELKRVISTLKKELKKQNSNSVKR
jgi:hypothetical protein